MAKRFDNLAANTVPTIRDVAKRAAVSTATVSATLNETKYVSSVLKERVLRAIHELGYAPDGIAQSLKRGTSHLFGLIVGDLTNPFFIDLMHTIEAGARKKGYSLLVCNTDFDVAAEKSYLQLMRANRVGGVILGPAGNETDYKTAEYRQLNLPIVLVDQTVSSLPFDSVILDNRRAALQATNYLLDLGHRHIGMIAGPDNLSSAEERTAGFCDAFLRRGLPYEAALVKRGNYREDDAFRAAKMLLSASTRPTAVFVANNVMLIGFMRAVASLGLSCPRDISVASIDDFPWANAFVPRLTTVRQPIQKIGETALRLLFQRIAGNAPTDPTQVLLEPTLIVREVLHPPRCIGRSGRSGEQAARGSNRMRPRAFIPARASAVARGQW